MREHLNKALEITHYLLKIKLQYGIISEGSFYNYTIYLNKLEDYLNLFSEPSCFDDCLDLILTWNKDKTSSTRRAIKNMLITNLFITKKLLGHGSKKE